MRKILLTGGTGLIGFTLVKAMYEAGHHVIFTSRDKERAEALLKSEGLAVDRISVIEADFNVRHIVPSILPAIPEDVDTVIYNARSIDNLRMNEQNQISEDQFQNELYLAVTFPYLLTDALVKDSRRSLRDIIFISSMYGSVVPNPALYDDFEKESSINYGVAKAAQIQLTKELAVRLAKKNIRCNCVSYGGVEGRADDEFIKRYSALAPMGRMLGKNDLFPPLEYILNNRELHITGENLKVDGGWMLW